MLKKMEKKRKIAKVVRKVSFAEAEEADDEYWSKASIEERLNEVESLRRIFWSNTTEKIAKIIKRRHLYEEEG